ncbi:DEAD/DEAH box helicase, partial [Vibrio parahaemolyticus]|nr:DEAD/DEAH box helicase [Vibrio parahaemolyticus]
MTSTLLAEQSDSPVTPQRVLEEVFGYQTFRDGQQEVIESAVEGKDSLVIMPTGGGKSLCYQIPA